MQGPGFQMSAVHLFDNYHREADPAVQEDLEGNIIEGDLDFMGG